MTARANRHNYCYDTTIGEQATAQTGAAATQLPGAAGELTKQSELLRGQVDKFLSTIRAA